MKEQTSNKAETNGQTLQLVSEPTLAGNLRGVPRYDEVSETETEQTLRREASGVTHHLKNAGQQYQILVRAIRACELEKRLIVRALLAGGFPRSMISKVVRVGLAPDAVYAPYAQGQIGFKAAVIKAREAKPGKRDPKKVARKIWDKLFVAAHKFDKLVIVADGGLLVAVIPGGADELKGTGSVINKEASKYRLTVERK